MQDVIDNVNKGGYSYTKVNPRKHVEFINARHHFLDLQILL